MSYLYINAINLLYLSKVLINMPGPMSKRTPGRRAVASEFLNGFSNRRRWRSLHRTRYYFFWEFKEVFQVVHCVPVPVEARAEVYTPYMSHSADSLITAPPRIHVLSCIQKIFCCITLAYMHTSRLIECMLVISMLFH